MPYPLGEQLRFRYTGQLAEVIALLDASSYRLKLLDGPDRGETTIGFEDDLIPAQLFKGVETSPYVKPRKNPQNPKQKQNLPSTEALFYPQGAFEKPKETSKNLKTAVNFPHLKFRQDPLANGPYGLGLAFLTWEEGYQVYLLNDSDQGFYLNAELSQAQGPKYQNQYLGKQEILALGQLQGLGIQNAVLELEIPILKWSKTLKIKAKDLIASPKPLPLIEAQGRLKSLLNIKEMNQVLQAAQKPSKIPHAPNPSPNKTLSPAEQAARFNPKLDLHLEKMGKNQGLQAYEILKIQLHKLKEHLAQAREFRVSRLEIVHGKGEGVLREWVHAELASAKAEGQIESFELDKVNGGSTLVWVF